MSNWNSFQSFVTEQNIMTFTPLNENVDAKEVLPHLEYAEMNFIRGILGKFLYDDLKEKYITQNLNQDEITLVGLIKEATAYRAVAEALPFLSMKIRNSGIVKLSGENYNAVTTSDLKYLQTNIRGRAEYFERRLTDYICQNQNLFPLYTFSNDNNPNPNGSTGYKNGGIYLGRGVNKRGRYLFGDSKNN